jgi:hypothetical protein
LACAVDVRQQVVQGHKNAFGFARDLQRHINVVGHAFAFIMNCLDAEAGSGVEDPAVLAAAPKGGRGHDSWEWHRGRVLHRLGCRFCRRLDRLTQAHVGLVDALDLTGAEQTAQAAQQPGNQQTPPRPIRRVLGLDDLVDYGPDQDRLAIRLVN